MIYCHNRTRSATLTNTAPSSNKLAKTSDRLDQMNVANCFQKLIARIQPTTAEVELAQQHIATIRSRLNSTFKLSRVLVGGSFSRNTLIRGVSDVDLFAVIARSEATWGNRYESSETMLNRFRDQLARRLPNTALGRDVHAIVVPFSQGARVD